MMEDEGKLFDLDGNLVSEFKDIPEVMDYLGWAKDSGSFKVPSSENILEKGYIWVYRDSHVWTQIYPYDKLYDSRSTRALTVCPVCHQSYDLKKTKDRIGFEEDYVNLIAPKLGVYAASYHIKCNSLIQLIHPNSTYWKPCPEISLSLTIMNDTIFGCYVGASLQLKPKWSEAEEIRDWYELARSLGLTVGGGDEEWEEKLIIYIKGGM